MGAYGGAVPARDQGGADGRFRSAAHKVLRVSSMPDIDKLTV